MKAALDMQAHLGVLQICLLVLIFGEVFTCPTPPAVANSQVSISTVRSIKIATYTCDEENGYKLSGSNNTIACLEALGYSTWTPVQFSCPRVYCDEWPTIPNTERSDYYTTQSRRCCNRNYCVKYNRHGSCLQTKYQYQVYPQHAKTVVFNGFVNFTCSSGYQLRNGSTTMRLYCGRGGNWTTPDSTCKGVCASEPPDVPHSVKHITSRREGDAVRYICDPGYESHFYITCQSDKQWSQTSHCIKKDCGYPPTLLHGSLKHAVIDTNYGATVTYICTEHGYTLHGSDSIVCTTNGTWSPLPTCAAIKCGEPPSVENSRRLLVSGHSLGDSVTFLCDRGYNISGDETIRCEYDGHWTSPPTCQVGTCGVPPYIPNSMNSSEISSYNVGEEFSFQCTEGHDVKQREPIIRCLPTLDWTEPEECRRIHCSVPYMVANSRQRVSGHYYNDIVTYECKLGYILSGESKSFCQKDGHWSAPPQCHAVSCGSPPAVTSAAVYQILGFEFGDRVVYRCQAGFVIAGVDFITCMADGSWSFPPLCIPEKPKDVDRMLLRTTTATVSCGDPPVVNNSQLQLTGHEMGDMVIYQCSLGYQLSGNRSARCQVSGQWSATPLCQALSCGPPPTETQSLLRLEGSMYVRGTVGDILTYKCADGFTLDADDDGRIECLPTQRWSAVPDCLRVFCSEPFTVENSHRAVIGHYYNDTVSYTCHVGYVLSDDTISRCQADGHWSVPPDCKEIVCEIPPFIPNGKLAVVSGYKMLDTVVYECNDGYTMMGTGYVWCQQNGIWSQPPHCAEVTTVIPAPITSISNTQKTSSLPANHVSAPVTTIPVTTTTLGTMPNTIPSQSQAATDGIFTNMNGKSIQTTKLATHFSVASTEEATTPTLVAQAISNTTALSYDKVENLPKPVPQHETSKAPFASPTTTKSLDRVANQSNVTNPDSSKEAPLTHELKGDHNNYRNYGAVIGCSVLGSVALLTALGTILYLRCLRRRCSQREPNFIPVSNALYQQSQGEGQVMTVYSFKQSE